MSKGHIPVFADFYANKEIMLSAIVFVGILEAVLISTFTILLVLFVSHKVGGPVFKLEKNIEKIKNGDMSLSEIRFRSGDQGKILAERFNAIAGKWNEMFTQLKSNCAELSAGVEAVVNSDGNERAGSNEMLNKLKQAILKMEDSIKKFNI